MITHYFNSRILLVTLLCGLISGGLQAQDPVDQYLYEFVKSLDKNTFVRMSGDKIGALKCAPKTNVKTASAIVAISLAPLLFTAFQFARGRYHWYYASVFQKTLLVGCNATAFAVLCAGIGMLVKSLFISIDKKPYIIFYKDGLALDSKNILEWKNIEMVDTKTARSLFDFFNRDEDAGVTIRFEDRFGNVIKFTPEQRARLPLTAKNIVALARHYIKKAHEVSVANEEKVAIVEPSQEQPKKNNETKAKKPVAVKHVVKDDLCFETEEHAQDVL